MWNKLLRHTHRAPSGAVCVSPDARAVVDRNGLAVFHAGRGRMFKANGAGARIWQAIERRLSPAEMASELARTYGIPPEQAGRDVARFIAELRGAALVTVGE